MRRWDACEAQKQCDQLDEGHPTVERFHVSLNSDQKGALSLFNQKNFSKIVWCFPPSLPSLWWQVSHASNLCKLCSSARLTLHLCSPYCLCSPAEVCRQHLPLLPLRHQGNRVCPHRAVPEGQQWLGGRGRWERGGGPRGHWNDDKGNGCSEEGISCSFLFLFVLYIKI